MASGSWESAQMIPHFSHCKMASDPFLWPLTHRWRIASNYADGKSISPFTSTKLYVKTESTIDDP